MNKLTLSLAAIGAVSLLALTSAHAQIIITEVDTNGSSASYGADWFELTNEGSISVSLAGWKMDDSSNAFATAVPMSGVSSLAPGQSAVFLETSSASTLTSFSTAWFGANPPANLLLGMYSGSGVGLSNNGDGVSVFNSSGVLQAGVSFGSASSTKTFDNSVAQITNSGTNQGAISTLSAIGTNGAFTSNTGSEIGSPGTVGAVAVPEPSSYALSALVAMVFGLCVWRRKAVRA